KQVCSLVQQLIKCRPSSQGWLIYTQQHWHILNDGCDSGVVLSSPYVVANFSGVDRRTWVMNGYGYRAVGCRLKRQPAHPVVRCCCRICRSTSERGEIRRAIHGTPR